MRTVTSTRGCHCPTCNILRDEEEQLARLQRKPRADHPLESLRERVQSDDKPVRLGSGGNRDALGQPLAPEVPSVDREPNLPAPRLNAVLPVNRSARCTVGEAVAPGVANTEDRGDGQQKGYVILCDKERAKGFVRPVRTRYRHVGKRPKYPTRDLTAEEQERHGGGDDPYVKFEIYPPEMAPRTGRFWTTPELTSGCGVVTTMGQKLAETYARDPGFYSGTFCVACRGHFPVGADGEFVWDDGSGQKVGT